MRRFGCSLGECCSWRGGTAARGKHGLHHGCYIPQRLFRLEQAVSRDLMRSSGAIRSLKLREEGSSAVTRDCDTRNCQSRSAQEPVCHTSGAGDEKRLKYKVFTGK